MAKRSSRDRFTELLFYAVVILVAYLAMLVVWPFLAPLTWAAILAMTLRPVHLYFCIRLSRGNAALLTTLLAAALIIAPAAFLVAMVAQQVPLALDYLNGVAATTTPEQLIRWWTAIRDRVPFDLPADPVTTLSQSAQAAAAFLAGQAGSLLANVLSTFGSLLVMLFTLFFLLRDGQSFAVVIRRLLPFDDTESQRLITETSDMVVASVGAGLMVAAVQGLIGGIAFWALGLPAPAVWGVAMAICSLIPVVGATLVWVPVAAWLLISGEITRAIVLSAVCAVVVGSVDNVLRPLILSGRTSTSGLVVFIGLLGGASAFGFVGLVLGPIVLVTAGTLIEALTRRVHLPTDEVSVIETP